MVIPAKKVSRVCGSFLSSSKMCCSEMANMSNIQFTGFWSYKELFLLC